MIIRRYLTREMLISLLAVTGILLLIFLSNQLVLLLEDAASGKLASDVVIKLLAIQAPYLLSYLLPLGFYIAVLIVHGRFYVDNEMTVLFACGMSLRRLMSITLTVAILVMMVVFALTLYVNPHLLTERNQLIAKAKANSGLTGLYPGQFRASADGSKIFYIEKMSRDRHKVKDIFVAIHDSKTGSDIDTPASQRDSWSVLSAAEGYKYVDPKTEQEFMVAQDGNRYIGDPGTQNFQIMKFAKYGVAVPDVPYVKRRSHETYTLSEIWKTRKTDSRSQAELQWRISIPLSVLFLAVLAVPLARVNPRQGRFAQIIPAIIIYMVYVNMLFVAQDWLEQELIPNWLGLWWLHFTVFALALMLLIRQQGLSTTLQIFRLRKMD